MSRQWGRRASSRNRKREKPPRGGGEVAGDGGRWRGLFLWTGWVTLALFPALGGPLAAAEVRATVRLDPSRLSGADSQGNVHLYAPNPVQPGSSISHWDSSASPNLLMEPSANAGPDPLAVDLTPHQLEDIGWSTNGTSNFEFLYLDPSDDGFDHRVLGPERRAAFEAAANVWAEIVRSPVTIQVAARFSRLPCGAGGAVLAQAGPSFMFESFPNAPVADTWYPGPLAEALSGQDLSTEMTGPGNQGDVQVFFNSNVDNACLGEGTGYYYGLDAPPPGRVSFVLVALHEIGHGLGFLNFVNETNGAFAEGRPDIFSRFTLDGDSGRHWHQMTNEERAASARSGNVLWDGPRVRSQSRNFLGPSPTLTVDSPPSLAGEYAVATADFGAALTRRGVNGDLALAAPALACNPIENPDEVRGRIAVLDRGSCLFTAKVRNAQDAGALGVVVVNNIPGPPVPMGGDDAAITIPAIMVSQSDGAAIKEELRREPQPVECTPDPETLCLSGGRFRVRLLWTTADGASGAGQALPLSDDTGYFWFFSLDNVEVVVKVLNACGFADRFWVFAGGLTNVQVEMEVVDGDNGQVRTYRNPLGAPFAPIQDTQAFATCP